MNTEPKTSVTRRHFCQALTATAIAASTSSVASGATVEAKQWIDAHSHVWHPDTNRYPISSNFKPDAMQPASFTAEELLAHCKPAGVQRVVLIQMSFYESDHRYMSEVMQRYPNTFSGVSLIDWNRKPLQREVKRHKRAGMRGFRMHSRGDAQGWPTDRNVQQLWKLANDHDLAICPLINPEDIPAVDALCKRFPNTKVVVDHFARIGVSGKIEEDRLDQLCRLADHHNTHVKTSAFYALGDKQPPYLDLLPMIQRVVKAFGSDRLMWASDCPYQVQDPHNYQSSIDLIEKHASFLTEADKIAILRGTAERVFFA